MPITEAQREQRKKHLGSSDMAAVMGFDRYRNAYDVWLDKTGKLQDETQVSEAAEAGNMFEDGVLKFAEKELGKLVRNQYRSAPDLPIGSNIDALTVASGFPVEAKTAGLFGPLYEVWGDDGTDAVPDRTIIQAQTHMICSGKQICYVAAFLGGRGFVMFDVPEDEEVRDEISRVATAFWEEHVKKDRPPDNITPSLAILKRIRREPDVIADVPEELVQEWLGGQAVLAAAKRAQAERQAKLITALGQAEGGKCADGIVTYLEQTRKEYVSPETTFRVLRFKKGK